MQLRRGPVPLTGPSVPLTGPSVPLAGALFNDLIAELSVTVPGS